MRETPKVKVLDIELRERGVSLRLPFKFGVVTLTESPQAFCRVRLQLDEGSESVGFAAELMVPKWFDKNEALSNGDNFNQLRQLLDLAKHAYLAAGFDTPFGLMDHSYQAHQKQANTLGLNPLVAGFGLALLDRAVLDAVCHAKEILFSKFIKGNIPGITPSSNVADLNAAEIDGFLDSLIFQNRVHAFHTVGMLDPLTTTDQAPEDRIADGLPETLEKIIDVYGHRYFKIKVWGDVAADIDRLTSIAAILDNKVSDYVITLDGNEQYEDVAGVLELLTTISSDPQLQRFWQSTLFIEQPIKRTIALNVDVSEIAQIRPVIIDESDEALTTYLEAREKGYHGVSSKNCKGFYKSILNAAQTHKWNNEQNSINYFMSAEDLTCQGGLAVQQDLALVSLLGLGHVERNGHHYVNGMAGADNNEQAEFLHHHKSLYHQVNGRACLNISNGEHDLSSLDCVGFAAEAIPDFNNMNEMKMPVAA